MAMNERRRPRGRTTSAAGTAVGAAVLLCAFGPRAEAADFALAVEGGVHSLSGSPNSAKAVFDGSKSGPTFGGSVRVVFKRAIFVAAGARTFSKTGERVYVTDPGGKVFPLGHPLELRIVPVMATAGYRFRASKAFVPYLGVGGGLASVKEESTVGGVTETESQSKAAAHVLGGLEYGKGTLRFAAEVSWSTVPNAIGLGGVSKVYGEDDLGGLSAIAKIVVSTTSKRR
jgi:opacity protein-like surface antigen